MFQVALKTDDVDQLRDSADYIAFNSVDQLERFGSVRGVREASPGDIARIPGFSDTLAARILTYLGR